MTRTTAGRVEDLQIVYGVGGERLLPEIELAGIEEYRESRPVRIGNRAADQFQLDVYGFIMDTAWLHHKHVGTIDPISWDFLSASVDAVAERWALPDPGIWEVRGDTQHFTSSTLMAWVAVDRAIRLPPACGYDADPTRWNKLHWQIRLWIETEGVDPESGAFVQALAGGTSMRRCCSSRWSDSWGRTPTESGARWPVRLQTGPTSQQIAAYLHPCVIGGAATSCLGADG